MQGSFEILLCRSADEAARALEMVLQWMKQPILDPEKMRTVNMGELGTHFDFLAYRFYRGKRRIVPLVCPKSEQKRQRIP